MAEFIVIIVVSLLIAALLLIVVLRGEGIGDGFDFFDDVFDD